MRQGWICYLCRQRGVASRGFSRRALLIALELRRTADEDRHGSAPTYRERSAEHDLPAPFDFVIVVFLNIGSFYRERDGSEGSREVEMFTLPSAFVREHLDVSSSWQKVRLHPLAAQLEPFRGEAGLEQIAKRLGVPRPRPHHPRLTPNRLHPTFLVASFR